MKTAAILLMLMIVLQSSFSFAAPPTYTVSSQRISAPDVVVVDQNGKKSKFKDVISGSKPVVLQFIFATCTTICPVLSAGYVNLQNKLGSDTDKLRLVSISIDPENDTPKIMKDYLKRYGAKPGWDFYTGSRKDIDSIMRAMNAYIPNKMSHYALTFMHKPGVESWRKINGIMSSSEFITELKKGGLL